LEKYGPSKPHAGKPEEEKKEKESKANNRRASDGRVLIQPPATANIPRRHSAMTNSTDSRKTGSTKPPSSSSSHPNSPVPQLGPPAIDEMAEFAPNAFDGPVQYAPPEFVHEPKWYDRLVNALLGEDETRPDRRLALICSKCRLVNGLAHPGARTPEDVGKWRCSSCGSWNGVELPPSKKTTPSHSRAPSAAITNVEEVIQRARSESADSGSTEGFESLG
jgi:hypothetical protein